MRTPHAGTRRTRAGVFAAVGTAAVGSLFALLTGLGHGIGNASESVTITSNVVTTAPVNPAAP